MAIGLNAVKEICARCPLAMDEDLLQDLAQYKSYRDRSVMMAARSLIHLFRNIRPDLLHKRDRGCPTEATEEIEALDYGKVNAKDYVPGAEVLLEDKKEEVEINSDTDSDDEQWIDVQHSDEDLGDSEEDGEEVEEEEDDEEEKKVGSENAEQGQEVEQTSETKKVDGKGGRKILKAKRKSEKLQIKKDLAQKVTLDRILTDEDFKRIDTVNVRKQIQSSSKGIKRKIEETPIMEPSDLVKLSDIENIYKKRKHDKQARIESVKKGQVDREKFGYRDGRMNEHCSKTNREKRKTKNFQMMRHKAKGKVKRSFKDKQIALRNHLLKLKKMK